MKCHKCKATVKSEHMGPATISGEMFIPCQSCGHDIYSGEPLEEWSDKTPPMDIGEMSPAEELEFYSEANESQPDTEAPTGQKFDADKTQWDLTPWLAQTEVAEVLTYGANKYSRDNWRHVPESKRRYTAALFRHVVAWLSGEKHDPESGKHHLAHAACCILFMLETDLEA